MGRNDRIERAVAALLLLILAVACFVVLRPFLSALLWAAILSSSTWPVYVALERLLGGRRTAAAAVMIACAAVILLLPLALVLSHLAGEATELATAASRWMEVGPPEPPAWVATLPLVGPRLHAYWASVAQNGARLVADLRAYVGPAREWIVATGLSLGAGLAELVLALLVAFFFYRDGMAGMRALRSALGRVAGAQGARLLVIAGATIKSVVYGVLGTNLVQGVLAGLGLWAVGIPSPLLLGFALFFLCLVPLAPMLVFAPAIVWLIQQGAVGSAVFWGCGTSSCSSSSRACCAPI